MPLPLRFMIAYRVDTALTLASSGREAYGRRSMKAVGDIPYARDAMHALLAGHALDLPSDVFDFLPVGVYVCDREGRILRYSRAAAELWQHEPERNNAADRFCGSHQLYRPDGTPIAHEDCPMADVLSGGAPVRNAEIIMERRDGTRIVALVNIDPLRDEAGRIAGAINCFRDVTELRRLGSRVAESERQARDLLNALPAAVYTTDAEGRITFYNDAAAAFWGVCPELGKSEFCGSWKLFTPDGAPLPHDQCPMAVALRERRAIRNAEAIAERPDGSRVPFIPFPTPLQDSNGAFIGAVNILVDITERKRADDALRRRVREQAALHRFTDRLYRALSVDDACQAALDAIGAALDCPRASVLLLDDAGVMRFTAWRGLSDRYRQAVEGHSPWRPGERDAQPVCIGDVQVSDMPESLRAAVLAEEIGALAFVPLTVDGGVVGKFMPYFDAPHGFSERELELAVTIARQLGFFVERSRSEEARHQSEQATRLLAAVVDSSGDAILTKDLQGIITSWNGGAERLFGYAAEEIIGKPVTILIPPDRQNEEPIILERIRSGQRIQHYETMRQRKDGSLIDISLSISPVKDGLGRIVGASKIARDITERRRALDQQQLLLREMDHRIKNLFTLAAGVVSLSAQAASSPEALAAAVHDRLTALSRAHTLTLPRPSIDAAGTAQATTLHALIATIVAPYEGPQARVAISGADCPVDGHAITSLALLFNEFATNAAKYGSLSLPDGTVAVTCSQDDDQMRIVWTERGGPPIVAPGVSEGFGSVLAAGTVQRQLAGELTRDWQRDGLVIRLSASIDRFLG
jgi:PAS domain S-box-containing protein